MIAAPRNDWVDRVQQTLKKTQGKSAPYRTPAGAAALAEAEGTSFDLLLGRSSGVLINTYRHVGSLRTKSSADATA
jgi:hypothetical protein